MRVISNQPSATHSADLKLQARLPLNCTKQVLLPFNCVNNKIRETFLLNS